QVAGGNEDHLPTALFPIEDTALAQVLQICPGRLVNDIVTLLVTGNAVWLERMPQGVADQLYLPVIEQVQRSHVRLHFANFSRFATNVGVKLFNRPPDDLGLRDDEVSQVVVIRLGVKKGAAVLDRRFSQDIGDGDELEQPVP